VAESEKQPARADLGPELWRASDIDRRRVAALLQQAVNEGRLSLAEYDERVATVYAARTYAELNHVVADLPPNLTGPAAAWPVEPVAEPKARSGRRIPTALMVLWTIWGGVVVLNLTIWLMVMVTGGHLVYPWPIWVGLPPGAALLAVTLGVAAIRQNRT
jgi:hypothetical protein